MIVLSQYQKAQQIIRQYQRLKSKSDNSTIRLMDTQMSQQLFNVIVDYACPKKSINQRNITLIDVSRLTEDEIKEMPGMGLTRFNQLNAILVNNGFPKFPFCFPK